MVSQASFVHLSRHFFLSFLALMKSSMCESEGIFFVGEPMIKNIKYAFALFDGACDEAFVIIVTLTESIKPTFSSNCLWCIKGVAGKMTPKRTMQIEFHKSQHRYH